MRDHANCSFREILHLLLSVPAGGRACGWLSTVHRVCWCIKSVPNFLTVDTELCIWNDGYLAIVHATGQSNSSRLACIRNELSENTVATWKVYQNNTHSPCVQHFNVLFINASQSTIIGSLKLTTCSFETHTGWEDKAIPWQHLLASN